MSAPGQITFNKPGSSTETKQFATGDSLRPIFVEWARLAHSGQKLDDNQQKLLDDMTEMLQRNGLFSSQTLWDETVKGTDYEGQALQHALEAANTGNANTGDILNSISNRNQTSVSNKTTTGTTVNYVDLPTPEEFLDDFNTSYGIHISGLVQTGAIRPEVAAFARANAPMIFSNYLRERVGRLLKGEPLFKVVGTNADNKLVGSRTGQQADQQTIGTDVVSGQQTSGSAPAATPAPAASTPAATGTPTPAPTASTGSGGQQGTGGGYNANGDPTVGGAYDAAGTYVGAGGGGSGGSLTYNDVYNTDATSKVRETEALVSRNKLGFVSNLAPLDFLKDAATAQSLNLLYEGEKGTALRERETSTGGGSFATRRL